MNKKNLGIYIFGDKAILGVCSTYSGKSYIEKAIAVDINEENTPEDATFGSIIAKKIAEMKISYDYLGIALDSGMFVQHRVSSGFTDNRKIAKTIKYDVEDMVGDDISSLATSYIINSQDQSGTKTTVFTAKKSMLVALLRDLQKHGLDPEVIEPDSISLMRMLCDEIKLPKEKAALIAACSKTTGYIGIYSEANGLEFVRSFKVKANDKTSVILQNIKMTIASVENGRSIDTIYLAGEQTSSDTIAYALGLETEKIELPSIKNDQDEPQTDGIYAAILYGASAMPMSHNNSDFRSDFSPYQGRKKIIRSSVSALYIAVALVVAVFAWKATLIAGRTHGYASQIEKKVAEEYSVAMKGREMDAMGKAVLTMQSEIGKLNRIKAGETADVDAVPTRLQFVLEILTAMPKTAPVKVDSINITSNVLRIDGSTSSRTNTQTLLSEIDKHKNIEREQESLKQVGANDNFTVNLKTKK